MAGVTSNADRTMIKAISKLLDNPAMPKKEMTQRDGFTPSLSYFSPPDLSTTQRIIRRIPILRRLVKSAVWNPPDWVSTPYNRNFITDPVFVAAYRRAIQAGGFDYRIPWRVHQILWAAHSVLNRYGDFVELGTGKGFMMSAVMASIPDWNSAHDRRLWLYDVFEMPNSSGFGHRSLERYYADGIDSVKANFSEWNRVEFVQGDVCETIKQHAPDAIAFLHVDLNDARSEGFAINYLYERVVLGGIIVLDDYANVGLEAQYEECNRVFKALGRPILTTPSGQGIVVK